MSKKQRIIDVSTPKMPFFVQKWTIPEMVRGTSTQVGRRNGPEVHPPKLEGIVSASPTCPFGAPMQDWPTPNGQNKRMSITIPPP